MSGPEIEAALGPEWQRVRADYDRALAALSTTSAASRPALPPEAPEGPPSSPKK